MPLNVRIPIVPNDKDTKRITSRLLPPDENGCRVWPGAHTPHGYGRISINSQGVYTHRYMATLVFGPIPDKMHVDHLCRNTSCCEPTHLEIVTPAENSVARAVGRQAWGSHCKRGHPRTEENTYYHKNGSGRRECRLCSHERSNERNERIRNQR